MDFVYVTLEGVYNYSKSALSRLENDFALLDSIMRGSCLTRIYPYSSKSFMAFSGSLKLSVNSYSEKKELNMVYTVEFLIMINVIVFCLLEILYKVYVFIIFLSKVLFFFLTGANRMIGLFKYQNFVSGIRKVNCSFVCTCKITLISLQLNTQSLVIRQYKCLNLYTVKW